MTAPKEQTVLFNMPQDQVVSLGGSMATTAFKPTPPMSSYLVAFIVGNLTGVSKNVPAPNGIGKERPVSIYSIPERWISALQCRLYKLQAQKQELSSGRPF